MLQSCKAFRYFFFMLYILILTRYCLSFLNLLLTELCFECHKGIYETKISLEFNAILQIGCVCKVEKTAKVRNVHDVWNLTELQMKTTAEYSYLEHAISFFYLYHRYVMYLHHVSNILCLGF